nr:hypothetical protein [Salinisphaera sp. G21_0]
MDHILGYIKPDELKRLKLVVNAGNGAAGHVIDAIEARFKETGKTGVKNRGHKNRGQVFHRA